MKKNNNNAFVFNFKNTELSTEMSLFCPQWWKQP